MTSSKLSVQLYTVRELLREDVGGTLRRLADIGFEQVEPFAFVSFGDELAEGLRETGLSAPTTHQRLVGEDVEPIFEAARALGITTVIDPHIADERWTTAESVASVAADLNALAGIAAGYGLTVGYHNHSHELRNQFDGVTALEALAENLDDAVVLEVDTYWVAAAGVDPVALLHKLGDRVQAIHVKDGPGSLEPLDQVAVGSGSLPIREIVEAAPQALRVIELDDSRGDRFQAVADSYAFLTGQGLA
jgi:sugar phosphate isomerase/epimerase